MPRNMSFSMTTEQVRNRTKTVTRRKGWDFLKPGDVVNAVVKSMGLKKGEKVERICQIRVLSIRSERLMHMDPMDCVREGFPEWSVYEFAEFITGETNWHESKRMKYNRIEFQYID